MKKLMCFMMIFVIVLASVSFAQMNCSIVGSPVNDDGKARVTFSVDSGRITSYKIWDVSSNEECADLGVLRTGSTSYIVYDFTDENLEDETSFKLCFYAINEDNEDEARCSKIFTFDPSLHGSGGGSGVNSDNFSEREHNNETVEEETPVVEEEPKKEDDDDDDEEGGSSMLPLLAGIGGGLLGLLGLKKLFTGSANPFDWSKKNKGLLDDDSEEEKELTDELVKELRERKLEPLDAQICENIETVKEDHTWSFSNYAIKNVEKNIPVPSVDKVTGVESKDKLKESLKPSVEEVEETVGKYVKEASEVTCNIDTGKLMYKDKILTKAVAEDWVFKCDSRFCPVNDKVNVEKCGEKKCPGPCDEVEEVCGGKKKEEDGSIKSKNTCGTSCCEVTYGKAIGDESTNKENLVETDCFASPKYNDDTSKDFDSANEKKKGCCEKVNEDIGVKINKINYASSVSGGNTITGSSIKEITGWDTANDKIYKYTHMENGYSVWVSVDGGKTFIQEKSVIDSGDNKGSYPLANPFRGKFENGNIVVDAKNQAEGYKGEPIKIKFRTIPSPASETQGTPIKTPGEDGKVYTQTAEGYDIWERGDDGKYDKLISVDDDSGEVIAIKEPIEDAELVGKKLVLNRMQKNQKVFDVIPEPEIKNQFREMQKICANKKVELDNYKTQINSLNIQVPMFSDSKEESIEAYSSELRENVNKEIFSTLEKFRKECADINIECRKGSLSCAEQAHEKTDEWINGLKKYTASVPFKEVKGDDSDNIENWKKTPGCYINMSKDAMTEEQYSALGDDCGGNMAKLHFVNVVNLNNHPLEKVKIGDNWLFAKSTAMISEEMSERIKRGDLKSPGTLLRYGFLNDEELNNNYKDEDVQEAFASKFNQEYEDGSFNEGDHYYNALRDNQEIKKGIASYIEKEGNNNEYSWIRDLGLHENQAQKIRSTS